MANKNCYIYTRVSTLRQLDGYSLQAQSKALKDYAEYRGLNIVGKYCDAGISGKDIEGRPDFKKMMNDIINEKDHVSYILVFKLSRFGRNTADILKSIQTLKDYGVELVSVKESIDSSTHGGKLTLSILSAVAEMEKENINVQFLAGRQQKLLGGEWPYGPVPYGYQVVDKVLKEKPEEVEIIKKVFSLYIEEGETMSSVAAKTCNNPNLVRRILNNQFYCGRICFNKVSEENQHELIEVKTIYKPLVSEDLFNKVQEKRKEVANRYEKSFYSDHIFSGLIKCPKCGRMMVGNSSREKSRVKDEYCKPFLGYFCDNHRKRNKSICSFNKILNKEPIEYYIFNIIKNLEFYKEFNDAINDNLLSKDEIKLLDDKIKSLKEELAYRENEKDKIGLSIDGLNPLSLDYDAKYDELSNLLDKCYDLIDELEEKIKETHVQKDLALSKIKSSERVKSYLKNLGDVIDQMTDLEKKQLCNLLIDHIEIDETSLNIKSIWFKIPLAFSGKELIQAKTGEEICFVLEAKNFNIEPFKKKAKGTYSEIKQYIKDKYQANVSCLNIAQIKRKNGLDMGNNYNLSKKDNAKVPNCPIEKEKMIVDALIHFGLIEKG